MLNIVTGPDFRDYIGNKVPENSGSKIRREIKGEQLGEKVSEKLGEEMGEKTEEKVGESLGEIHKLNLCRLKISLSKSKTMTTSVCPSRR